MKKRPMPEDRDAAMDHLPLQMGLPAIDLTAQGAVIAAVVNDLSGELIYARVQEENIKLYHEFCARVEEAFFAE